jgi:hypothetical protein
MFLSPPLLLIEKKKTEYIFVGEDAGIDQDAAEEPEGELHTQPRPDSLPYR